MLGAGVAGAVLLLLVFLGPGSFRIWSSQRQQTRELSAKVATLDRTNEQLQAQAERLQNPAAIKELARQEYGMVPKGSKAYAILPSPAPSNRPSGAWPFVQLKPETAGGSNSHP